MLEAFKGINLTDPKFYIPVIIGAIVLFIAVTLAKKLIKFVLVIAVVGLAVLLYFSMPSIKLEDGVAVFKLKGQEYMINPKNVKVESVNVDGKTKIYLKSGETTIELPFSRDYVERYILAKLKGEDQQRETP